MIIHNTLLLITILSTAISHDYMKLHNVLLTPHVLKHGKIFNMQGIIHISTLLH